MKVYIERIADSRGIERVYQALKKYHPESVGFVDTEKEADLCILHVIGRLYATMSRVDKLKKWGKRVALIQYSMRRTLRPSTVDWKPLWKQVDLVWSYYNLDDLCAEDSVDTDFNFYYAPLGVEADIFKKVDREKKYVIATSGLSYLTECVRECHWAANRVKGKVFHVGPNLKVPDIEYSDGMSDEELAVKYSECQFVSGLRRVEGFEFPVLEGLLCGARPICFNKPHYVSWFKDYAEFIEESPERTNIMDSLTELFKKGARPVTDEEIENVKKYFNWVTILEGFWKYAGT